eukprot:7056740-Heterocapsa_arctica.AAC.1
MDRQLQEESRIGRVPGHPQLPGECNPEQNDGRRAREDRSGCGGADREQGQAHDYRGDDEAARRYREHEPEDRAAEDRGEADKYRAHHRSRQGDDRDRHQGHRQ